MRYDFWSYRIFVAVFAGMEFCFNAVLGIFVCCTIMGSIRSSGTIRHHSDAAVIGQRCIAERNAVAPVSAVLRIGFYFHMDGGVAVGAFIGIGVVFFQFFGDIDLFLADIQ